MWVIWLIIGVTLLIVEMFTLTFYLLWLGIGALVALVLAFILPDAYALQIVAGCIVAIVLTIWTKPLTRRLRHSRGFRDVIDELVGKEGVVVESIGAEGTGIVKVGNESWSARSESPVDRGEKVIVLSRTSTTLEVQKWGGI
ncbi:NfeD family protein [Gorillibacterium massiliense]|uniref:NfeD family protein n=1 Tax=Gorillibacterium massiliense TaxID=1280390 RepID=UPI0004AE672A|nr:NfeD family protein [Gorillibacterium massiliense]